MEEDMRREAAKPFARTADDVDAELSLRGAAPDLVDAGCATLLKFSHHLMAGAIVTGPKV